MNRLMRVVEGRVVTGPFAGMRYPARGVGSAPGPKLLGTYEAELHEVIGRFVGESFDVLVNVGCGEGYYIVGLLLRIPTARGVAFEADEGALGLIREMAALNGVADRLEVRGRCVPDDLVGALAGASRPGVVMDVEGAEEELLDPAACPALGRASVLVEVHEHLRPGVADRLTRWYAGTHVISRIPTAAANCLPLPVVPEFTARQVRLLSDEMRSVPMEWFWMTPSQKGRGDGSDRE
jgi:hypothetical protein